MRDREWGGESRDGSIVQNCIDWVHIGKTELG